MRLSRGRAGGACARECPVRLPGRDGVTAAGAPGNWVRLDSGIILLGEVMRGWREAATVFSGTKVRGKCGGGVVRLSRLRGVDGVCRW